MIIYLLVLCVVTGWSLTVKCYWLYFWVWPMSHSSPLALLEIKDSGFNSFPLLFWTVYLETDCDQVPLLEARRKREPVLSQFTSSLKPAPAPRWWKRSKCDKVTIQKSYMKLIDELSQYKLVSLCATGNRQHIGHRLVDRSLLLDLYAFQVAVKPRVARQLEALVLRSKGSHVLIRPHGPRACSDMANLICGCLLPRVQNSSQMKTAS